MSGIRNKVLANITSHAGSEVPVYEVYPVYKVTMYETSGIRSKLLGVSNTEQVSYIGHAHDTSTPRANTAYSHLFGILTKLEQ